jgi:hypothetical protein
VTINQEERGRLGGSSCHAPLLPSLEGELFRVLRLLCVVGGQPQPNGIDRPKKRMSREWKPGHQIKCGNQPKGERGLLEGSNGRAPLLPSVRGKPCEECCGGWRSWEGTRPKGKIRPKKQMGREQGQPELRRKCNNQPKGVKESVRRRQQYHGVVVVGESRSKGVASAMGRGRTPLPK